MSRSAEARYDQKYSMGGQVWNPLDGMRTNPETYVAPRAGPVVRHQAYLPFPPGGFLPGQLGMPFAGGAYTPPPAPQLQANAYSTAAGRSTANCPTVTGDKVDEDVEYSRSPKIVYNGNQDTYNLNPLLANCVLNHEYSRLLWEKGPAFTPLLNEAQEKLTHVEPWQTGTSRTPSTAFCILVRLFQLGLTQAHLRKLTEDPTKPLVRCLGFLFLRYVLTPKELWAWCGEAVQDDDAEVPNSFGESGLTVSSWLKALLTEQKYYGTILPRIPVKIEREFKVKMMLLDESRARAVTNARDMDEFIVGAKVRAIYSDAKNDPAWYDGVIDAVAKGPEETLKKKFWVSFPEYGNQELIRLGDMELVVEKKEDEDKKEEKKSRRGRSSSSDAGKRRSKSPTAKKQGEKQKKRRARAGELSPSPSPTRGKPKSDKQQQGGESLLDSGALMARVRQKERDAASSYSSDYARRPTGYKEALALKLDRYTARKRSRSPPKKEVDAWGVDAVRDEHQAKERRRTPSPDRKRRSPSPEKAKKRRDKSPERSKRRSKRDDSPKRSKRDASPEKKKRSKRDESPGEVKKGRRSRSRSKGRDRRRR